MTGLSTERIAEMLNDLEDYELDWSEWETEFLVDMKDRLTKALNEDRDLTLTTGQLISLNRIYDKFCKESSV